MSKPSPSVKTTILTAPQGWGKSVKAEGLRQEFGCTSVVDEWWPGQPIKAGALHLTCVPASQLRNNKPQPQPYRIVARGWD